MEARAVGICQCSISSLSTRGQGRPTSVESSRLNVVLANASMLTAVDIVTMVSGGKCTSMKAVSDF